MAARPVSRPLSYPSDALVNSKSALHGPSPSALMANDRHAAQLEVRVGRAKLVALSDRQTVNGAIAIRQRTSQRAVFPHSDAEG